MVGIRRRFAELIPELAKFGVVGLIGSVIDLGGAVLYDRTDSTEEPLQVFADLDGHPFCIFVFAPD